MHHSEHSSLLQTHCSAATNTALKHKLSAPALQHLGCFAAVGSRAPEIAFGAGWNGTALLNDTLTQQPSQLGSPEMAAVLAELWSICDERCSVDRSMCAARSYRTCDLAATAVKRSPIAVSSYLYLEEARNATRGHLTLANCTCSEHLNCVMGLKLGFLNQINVLFVLSFALSVLLLFDLAASHALHRRWDVFAARCHVQTQEGDDLSQTSV